MENNIWNVKPTESINEIRFGMHREEVRKEIGSNYREFKKSIYSRNTADDYGNYHIFYDKDNNVEAIEVFGKINIYINGKKIFPGKIVTLKRMIPDLCEDEGCYISKSLSIGVEEKDGLINSILMGRKEYY